MNNVGVDERSSPTHIFTVAELAQEAIFAVFFKLIIASNSQKTNLWKAALCSEKQTVGRPQWSEQPSQELLSPIVNHSMAWSSGPA